VLYERADELYAIELRRDGELVKRIDQVFFDSLGETLEQLIDDGSWRRIRVQCLSGSKPTRQGPHRFSPLRREAFFRMSGNHTCAGGLCYADMARFVASQGIAVSNKYICRQLLVHLAREEPC